jgi:hypothetical protein
MGYFADGPIQNYLLLILSVFGLGLVPAETIIVEGRDVSLGGLLIAALGVPSVLVGPIATSLLHALEELRPSHWSFHVGFGSRLCLRLSKDIEIGVI